MEDKNSYIITQTKMYIDQKIQEFSGKKLVELPTDVAMEAAYNDVRVFLDELEKVYSSGQLFQNKYFVIANVYGTIGAEVRATNFDEAKDKAEEKFSDYDFGDLDNVEYEIMQCEETQSLSL